MEDTRLAVELAIRTLADEFGCDPGDVTVNEINPVTWPDSSLGCPQPGMMYMQIITPGYQIRLVHAGQEYLVHTDRGHRAVRCRDGGIMHNAHSASTADSS